MKQMSIRSTFHIAAPSVPGQARMKQARDPPFPSARHPATIRKPVQEQRKTWLQTFRLKLTIVLSLVMLLAFLFYALRGEGFPDSFWVACGSVGAVLWLAWWLSDRIGV